MAEVQGTSVVDDIGFKETVWAALANGDTGRPVALGPFGERSVQVGGTFGAGGTIIMEGSNDAVTWFAMEDLDGAAVSFTANGWTGVRGYPAFLRPSVTGGDGTTSLTLRLVERKTSV